MSDSDTGSGSGASIARSYYNSSDAEIFYSTVWGGEDIHVGLYASEDEPISMASRRTVETLADTLPSLAPGDDVLDLGSGYCGAARFIAKRFAVNVNAINVSEVENERARTLNDRAGLAERIEVHDCSFEALPVADASQAAAWSQDAILHSSNRGQVFREVARTLRPGGVFVFTDPMQADDCPPGVLDPILSRIHLSSLGSVASYRALCAQAGLRFESFDDHTGQLVHHYGAVLRETQRRRAELVESGVDEGYIDRMLVGLQHWIDGGRKGHLCWGLFKIVRPDS